MDEIFRPRALQQEISLDKFGTTADLGPKLYVSSSGSGMQVVPREVQNKWYVGRRAFDLGVFNIKFVGHWTQDCLMGTWGCLGPSELVGPLESGLLHGDMRCLPAGGPAATAGDAGTLEP